MSQNGTFNVFKMIPLFNGNSGWWCTEPTKHDTFIDYSQSDLDIAVRNTEIAYECQAVIIVHKNFTSEVRTFITYSGCDEKVLIELLRKGSLRGLVL
jgi:hypothetical protein